MGFPGLARQDRTGQTSRGDVCPCSFPSWNNAEPGSLSLPAALLLTPMIYSWLCPVGGAPGAAAVFAFLADPDCQLGRIGRAQRMPWAPLMNRHIVGRRRGCTHSSCRGPGSPRAASAHHLCSDQLPQGLLELAQPQAAPLWPSAPLSLHCFAHPVLSVGSGGHRNISSLLSAAPCSAPMPFAD